MEGEGRGCVSSHGSRHAQEVRIALPPGNGDADIGPEPGSDRAVKHKVANRFQGSDYRYHGKGVGRLS